MRPIRALLERYGQSPRWLRVAITLGWAGFVWWLSSRRGSDLAGLGMGNFLINGAHVAVFGVLGGLVFLAWPGPFPRRLPWSTGVTVAYGMVDELHQAMVPGRSPSFVDVLSDVVGGLLAGCALLWILNRDERARRAIPWILGLALGSVCLATWTDM